MKTIDGDEGEDNDDEVNQNFLVSLYNHTHNTTQIQLTQAQLQQIVMQMQGKPPGQPIVIQTSNTGDQLNSTVTSNGCDQFTSQVSI